MTFFAYLLRCADGSYYAGHTDELDKRIAEHDSGLTPGYTQTRLPIELVWSEGFPNRLEALEAEKRIKGWSRAKKEALIKGDWGIICKLAKKDFGKRRDNALRYGPSQELRPYSGQTDVGIGPVSNESPLVLSSPVRASELGVSKDEG